MYSSFLCELAVVLVYIGSVVSLPDYSDNCGCLLNCRKSSFPRIDQQRIVTANKEDEKISTNACWRGCHFYQAIIKQNYKSLQKDLIWTWHRAQEDCFKQCSDLFSNEWKRSACVIGCKSGCWTFSSNSRGPTVKLTILIEDTISELDQTDKSELEPLMTDPGLQPQIEDTQSPNDVKSKIPSSYFTNLPVHHEPEPPGWGCDEELLNRLAGEPMLCAALFVFAAVIMLAAYWTSTKLLPFRPDRETDDAPPLPEKMPLYPAV